MMKNSPHQFRVKSIKTIVFLFLLSFSGHFVFPLKTYGQKKANATPASNMSFKKHVLTQEFIAEGVAVGDVNKDGKVDVLAGAYWFEAPSWKKHEITKPEKFYYDKGYSDAFVSRAMDVNLDGWIDFLRVGFPGKEALWFENPGKKEGHWKTHVIDSTVANESADFLDVDGDGRLDLLSANQVLGQMNWFKSPASPKNVQWHKFTISKEKSPGTHQFSHGLGLGDINKDGRKDVIIKQGWWEAPQDPKKSDWAFHQATLGEDCAQMYAYDFDGDGDQDVVSSSAHSVGIWWYEQITDDQNTIQWQRHVIWDKFTQTHGLDLADMNSDGHPDLVTGKRYFAHMGKDPGEYEPAVLYWFELKPGKNPQWIPHEIDKDSGVGVNVVAKDITKDGYIDIIVANKKGVFVFEQQRK